MRASNSPFLIPGGHHAALTHHNMSLVRTHNSHFDRFMILSCDCCCGATLPERDQCRDTASPAVQAGADGENIESLVDNPATFA
jgi:hypothetical protein